MKYKNQVNSKEINSKRNIILEWEQQLKYDLSKNCKKNIDLFLVEKKWLDNYLNENENINKNDLIEKNNNDLIESLKNYLISKNIDILPQIFPVNISILFSSKRNLFKEKASFLKGKIINNLLLIDFKNNLYCFFFLYKEHLRQGYLQTKNKRNYEPIDIIINKCKNSIIDSKYLSYSKNFRIFIFNYNNKNDLDLKNKYQNISQNKNSFNINKQNYNVNKEINKKNKKQTKFKIENNNVKQEFDKKDNNNKEKNSKIILNNNNDNNNFNFNRNNIINQKILSNEIDKEKKKKKKKIKIMKIIKEMI